MLRNCQVGQEKERETSEANCWQNATQHPILVYNINDLNNRLQLNHQNKVTGVQKKLFQLRNS